MNGSRVFNREFPVSRVAYHPRDAILYALGTGVGCGDETGRNPDTLRFLYEKNLAVLPTFANVLGPQLFWTGEDEFGIDWKKLLHIEQRLVISQPLAVSGEVEVHSKVTGIRDKGVERGALVFQQKKLTDACSGRALCSIAMVLMLRAEGGCGDFGLVPDELPELPGRQPDTAMKLHAATILPFVYRLSGDFNPLHIDPEIALEAGFARPVLHGLCTMGILCRALLQRYGSLEPERLRELSLRFTHPVYPGDDLVLECWDEGGGLVRFQAISSTSGARVVDRGLARFH